MSLKSGIPIFLLVALMSLALVAWRRGVAWRDIAGTIASSVRTVGTILVTFLLIGLLTGLWRSSGCIPTIVCGLGGCVSPQALLPLVFLMNGLVAVLTGTAFGTAATMGTITMSIAHVAGASPFWTGGAILSGCYFGDRWSPVSTSALLVATLTKTDLYGNLWRMVSTTVLPFALSIGVYGLVGLFPTGTPVASAVPVTDLFAREFALNWICALPAAAVVVLSLCRVDVRRTLLASLAVSAVVAVAEQHATGGELLRTALAGFQAKDAEVARLIDGGGLVSMLRVTIIVCLAAGLSGLARIAGFVDGCAAWVGRLAARFGRYGATLVVAVVSSAVACNQTLAILLTHELTEWLYPTREDHALDLEDSAVVVPPLVPWSIASAVVLDSCGAPLTSIAAAVFLFLLPISRFLSCRDCKSAGGV